MPATSEAQTPYTLEQQKAEVEAVLTSAGFSRAPRHSKLLRYLCDKHFSGHDRDVKEYSLATEVLGRGPNFDQSRDAIVRVEMHRLRKKLKDFYATEGASHTIEIVINPGQYVPCFVPHGGSPNPTLAEAADLPGTAIESPAAHEAEAPGRGSMWKEITLATVIVLIGSAGLVALRTSPTASVGATSGTHSNTMGQAVPALGPDAEVRILCGFKKDRYIDREGKVWGPDAFYTGGYTENRPRQYFARTDDPVLFETLRFGDFRYDIPAKPGNYELWLYFAETAYGPGTTTGGGENSRIFNVYLNDAPLLTDFDITSDAAGANTADIRRFKNVTPAPDGKVHLRFESVHHHPLVDAIRLSPMQGDKLAPIRVIAQENSYTDSHGAIWSPDNYYSGGQLSTHKESVKGTGDVDLYAGERYGNFSYALPVDSRGKYTVNLYMAETYWGPNSPGRKGGAGTRVFDVYCNGVALLRKFDIYKEYGAFQAAKKTFRGLEPNAQGKLVLTFVPVANYASVYAIEVLEE
jgi:hypothetical protein